MTYHSLKEGKHFCIGKEDFKHIASFCGNIYLYSIVPNSSICANYYSEHCELLHTHQTDFTSMFRKRSVGRKVKRERTTAAYSQLTISEILSQNDSQAGEHDVCSKNSKLYT